MSEQVCTEIDQLQEARDYNKINELLEEALKTSPQDVELLWRLARYYYDKNEETSDKNQKKEYILKSIDTIEKCLTIDPEHWAVHKWWAISTSAIGEYVTSKEKIANAFKIKEHALKSLELKPKDPTTLHLLGRWCFSVASIGFIERGVASALFGTPPQSSYEESLKYLLEAYEVDPTIIRNLIFIGDCYTNLKNQTKAKEFYQKAASAVPKSEFEKTLVEEAKKKAK
ncbi:hypothetical protein CYY_000120 [Polysphondylium violaceum]|uniref:Regulator of microtubule dynamics protein 1 n=1 Tax=Polysphondylium violaceum TaxID=133409 RepID=A0A8J4Q3H9_9MYCE|nr:hypothetical protein CYY_000120 [Polysphondylium violaceum]